VEREQEEGFVVLERTLTLMLGHTARGEVLPRGSVAAVPFLAYGAPPIADAADELPEPPTR